MEVKKPTTYDEQYQKLVARGCDVSDEQFCKETLGRINYYRLSAYFLAFKQPQSDSYKPGTSFHTVFQIYEFDRKMRTLLFSIIEEIELYLRTRISYYFSHKYGALGYEDACNFNNYHDHARFSNNINELVFKNKRSLIVKHHIKNYGGKFPLWAIIEFFSFGDLTRLFTDLKPSDGMDITDESFHGLTQLQIRSWLICITGLRNRCAHYAPLYNVIFPSTPIQRKGFCYFLNQRIFDYILLLKWLYFDSEKWQNTYLTELKSLIDQYAGFIDLTAIGFPPNWEFLLSGQSELLIP